MFELIGWKTAGIGRGGNFWLAPVANVSMVVTPEVVKGLKELSALEEDDCVVFRWYLRGFPANDEA